MYSEVFDFFIVSKNLWMQQILQQVTPLEDCTYHFTTMCDFEEICEISFNRNMAFIIDDESLSKQGEDVLKLWAEEKDNGKEMPETALLVFGEQTGNYASLCGDMDYIWLMKEKDDQELLKKYFAKLVLEMKERADAKKQTICFQTLIDSCKDLIWFKDVDGRHLIVNDEFCSFVNKTKKQIYKQGHCYIWNASKEDEKVCLDSDHKIMQGRETQKFEEQVHTNEGDYIIQSYKSPLTERGEVFGTCGIGKNITSEINLERKMETILNHIPFAVAVVSKDDILTYKNKMFDTYFPEAADYLGKDVTALKKQLHFPENLEEEAVAEIEIPVAEELAWFSYCEKNILDAFDSRIEKMLVLQDITAKKRLEKQKERMAYTDYLTGLSNRRGMLRILEGEKNINNLTVILIDIDDFKMVNDTFGHAIGDEVLREFAEVLKKNFMADYVARYGGDEFLVITRLNQKDNIREKADSLLQEAAGIVYGNGQKRGIKVCCGIAVGALAEQCTLEDLIRMSDEAMYHIKKKGKNGYWFYDETTDEDEIK